MTSSLMTQLFIGTETTNVEANLHIVKADFHNVEADLHIVERTYS